MKRSLSMTISKRLHNDITLKLAPKTFFDLKIIKNTNKYDKWNVR